MNFNFLSSDKDPSNAKSNQNLTKMMIVGGFVAIIVVIIMSKGNSDHKRQIGDFQIVNEEDAVKTRFMGDVKKDMSKTLMQNNERRADYQQFKRDRQTLLDKQKEQEEKIAKMYQLMVKNSGQTIVAKTPDENFMGGKKNFPLTPGQTQDGKPQLLNDFARQNEIRKGNVPPIARRQVVRYQEMPKEQFFGSDIDFTESSSEKKKSESIEPINMIPSGSILPVVLLSGFDAPTLSKAKSSPIPVLMKVTEPGKLPNNFAYDVKDCFILGEGYGDLSSERAYIRTTKLSCLTYDGLHIETEMPGFVAGIDNKNGIRGKVVSKQNDLLTRTALAGFLEGMSKGFNLQNQTVTQSALGTTAGPSSLGTADVAKMGLFGGASEAAERLSDFYMDLADELTPVIEIPAGIEVDVIVLDKRTMQTLEESKQEANNKKKRPKK